MKAGVVGLSAALTFLLTAPADVFADNEVTRWNEQAMDAIRVERKGAADASRLYAMVNVAMYDAVNGIDRARWWSSRSHAMIPPAGAPWWGSRRAAAAAAGHAVASALYPSQAAAFDAQLAADLAEIGGSGVAAGQAWGEYVGGAVVSARANDGSSPKETQPAGTGPGEHRADFTSAQFRNMDEFAVADASIYVSAGPPALTSREYASALNEVRLWGDASYVNAEYDAIFRFWKGGGGSARPPGEWIKIAIVVAEQRGTTNFLSRTARLFALLGMSLGDSTIAVWDAKYTYHFWRPTPAIQEADTDGNPETTADPTWAPRNGSAGSSPEHTSGQSAYAGAGSTVLGAFYCNDAIEFTFTGDNAVAGPRTFAAFSDAAREAGRARIMAGIHYEFSNAGGQATGRGVAREVMANSLLRSGWGASLPDCSPY